MSNGVDEVPRFLDDLVSGHCGLEAVDGDVLGLDVVPLSVINDAQRGVKVGAVVIEGVSPMSQRLCVSMPLLWEQEGIFCSCEASRSSI